MSTKTTARKVYSTLSERYQKVTPPLNFTNGWELLVAAILSAQTTDVRVNIVTKSLFSKYKSLSDYATADLAELENIIKTVGLYKTKARHIKQAAEMIITKFSGELPNNIEDLLCLPGVGRKIANVFLGQWYGINDGFVVDTHVARVARRLGLSEAKSIDKLEKDLQKLFPRSDWTLASLRIIFYGREICKARNPECGSCSFRSFCPTGKEMLASVSSKVKS